MAFKVCMEPIDVVAYVGATVRLPHRVGACRAFVATACRADVMAFPGFTGPVQLCDIVAEMAAADPPKHGRRKKATYQPVVLGGYENLRFSPGNRIET